MELMCLNILVCHLSTATVAPPDVAKDFIEAYGIGESAYQDFREGRLESNPPTKQLHDKMKTLNLKTSLILSKKEGKYRPNM